MSILDLQTLLIALIISVSTGLLGVFLVLRKNSMLIDAISHTVLLGIVLSYMVVGDLSSPFIILGATLIGVLTVFLIEALVNTKRVESDIATGTIFPFLFSIAIIIITTRFSSTHLDTHAINGNLEFAAFEQLVLFGTEVGSKTMYISLLVLVVIIVFIKVFFKELKISTFDAALATSLGISPIIIHYLLMTLVSVTAVTSFNAVGTILVVAMMIGPAATALLISKDLKKALMVAVLVALINASVGYLFAMFVFKGTVNIASTIATLTFITFVLVWIFEPKNGLITKTIKKTQQKVEYEFLAFMIHVGNHHNTSVSHIELNEDNINNELKWKSDKITKYINKGLDSGYIYIENKVIKITEIGKQFYELKTDELRSNL